MPKLITASRFPNPDAAYAMLVQAHDGLAPEASVALNTRLVLLLAIHVGDLDVLAEAIAAAKSGLPVAD